MNKMILIGGGALLFSAINIGGTAFLTKAIAPPPMAAATTVVEAEPLPEEVFDHNVQPEFVVNFQGKTKLKFLMIEMVIATHDKEVLPILEDHDPELRNTLLLLLAEQDSEALTTAEGKQALRDQALARIDEVVSAHYRSERIKDVYITRLVMQ